ncbi:hypothetical protein SASPL_115694 [Salvia splendens]|uniref:Reverse transcriptase Ty1/copia-type domain-containing protein n=1 Tax=Salvia splendens TaxID=180675 RepID=A0A8X9A0J0_SALSN|nr:hypothetical protein SASPL_115694 [Salvia splendens]
MTPQEARSGRKPGIAHLRVFGSKAYTHVPNQTRSKLDDKSKPLILIEYDSNTKGYKLYDPTSQKTMIYRDVEFDEEGVWDFSSNTDFTFIPTFGDQRIGEQTGDEQQEQTTPPTSPTSAVRSTPPSFLNERAIERTRSLDRVYEDTERVEDLTLFFLFADCEPVSFEEATTSENWRVTMDEEIKAIEKNDTWELEFKKVMTEEFEMTDIGLMAYYLGVEVKQREDGVFITQEHYAKEILKKFKMEDCKPINTPVECEVKLSKNDKEEKVDPTLYTSLVGSLRQRREYLDISKSTSGYVFYMGDTAFTWMSKKQLIVTLSNCEAEYVAVTFSVCHVIWLRSLLSELGWPQKEPTTICVDNKSAIAQSKNPVFHNQSKHIDTRYHYIRECVANQEIQVEYVKSQDQVADIFTKHLKYEYFIKIKMLLEMTNKV